MTLHLRSVRCAGASLLLGLLATTAGGARAAQLSPPPFPAGPQAPRGAPNILLIMTDDVGFGASSTFGGPIPTPTFDALAAAGTRYNAFHTTSICAPTRAALLTGRNHHSVGAGVVPEMATAYRGYTSVIPATAAMIPKVLQLNGYATAMFGKHHNTPTWEEAPTAPQTHKPNGFGFDYFYGFLGGRTDQFAPALYENLNAVEPPSGDPGYILDRDLADHAIGWLRSKAGQSPDKPFFLYYVPGTLHAPVQAPKEWIAKFRGQFEGGWDVLRRQIFERQKKLGVIPADAALAPMPPGTRAWSALTADERKVAARYMEVYAAALSYADHEIGRIIDELKRSGQYDNTLIVYIQGDNGASVEGGVDGAYNYINRLNAIPGTTAEALRRLDEIGGPTSQPAVPAGWTRATNAPFPWNKGLASHLGGTRNGLVISWPGHIRDGGTVRRQFHSVVDLAPTIYEAVGITPPDVVAGVPQMPLEGVSMAYSFANPTACSPHTEQYFEMVGARGLYKDGWLLARRPVQTSQSLYEEAGTGVTWELYDLRQDYSQTRDVAAKEPARVADMSRRFDELAALHNVNPISDDRANRIDNGGRPGFVDRPGLHRFYPGGPRLPDGGFADVRNRSWSMTADVVVPPGGADGMIVTQGGRFTGWGLMVTEGAPRFVYRINDHEDGFLDLKAAPLSPGAHQLAVAFKYDGGEAGKGGQFTLSVDGKPVGDGRVARTAGLLYGEDAAIGRDTGTPILAKYGIPFTFQGQISEVTIDTRDR